MLRGVADGRHDGGGRCQHQRTGAEHHQNGHGADDLAGDGPGEGVGFPPLLRLLEGLFLAVFFLRGGFPVFLPPIIRVFVFFEKAAFLPQAVVGLHQFAGQLAGVDAVVAAAHQRPEANFDGPAAQQARGHAFGCGVLPL